MIDEIERLEAGGNAWEASQPLAYRVPVKRPLNKVLQIRLAEDQWIGLREWAEELGVGPATLMRMWVVEKLKEKPAVRS